MPKNYDVISEKHRFKALSEKGSKAVSKSFILLYLKRSGLESSNAGVPDEKSYDLQSKVCKPALGTAVSKKTYKLAVCRNKAKRRIRALINELSKTFNLASYDLFFIGRRGIVERNFEDLQLEFIKAFKKLK